VTWVEDDNWIGPDWLGVVADVMAARPGVGACGGLNEAVCEAPPPAWFPRLAYAYAVGAQGEGAGDISDARGFLWGAGLTVRRAAWDSLAGNGFRPLLVDRRGTRLDSGGDAEICFALRLAGWRLWFEPRLRLRHFIQRHRLDWWYLRRLFRGVGASTVGFDPYLQALAGGPAGAADGGRRRWLAEARRVVALLGPSTAKLLASRRRAFEDDDEVLTLESRLGRLGALLRRRGAYDRSLAAVRHAPWRRRD
jgi:hypothetical protein